MASKRVKANLGKFVTYSILIVACIFWVFPMLWALWTTVRPARLATSFSFELVFSTENIVAAFTAFDFLTYLKNSVIVTLSALVVNGVLNTLAAYAMARIDFKGKKFVRILLMSQLMIPGGVLMTSNYLTIHALGLLDTHLAMFITTIGSASSIMLLTQGFRSIPAALEESAVIDGCNTAQILTHVYIPNLKPVYLTFAITSINFHWNNYMWPNIVINSASKRTLPIGLALLTRVKDTGPSWGYSTAATMIIMLPVLILFIRFQKEFVNSFVSSGIK